MIEKLLAVYIKNDIYYINNFSLAETWFYLISPIFEKVEGKAPCLPKVVHINIGWLSVGKNTTDTNTCILEIFYYSQKMEGSVPSPFYYEHKS